MTERNECVYTERPKGENVIAIRSTNDKQREVLAEFYSNFALAWLTFGLVTPFFIGLGNIFVFIFKLVFSVAMTKLFLNMALDYAS